MYIPALVNYPIPLEHQMHGRKLFILLNLVNIYLTVLSELDTCAH